MSRDSSQPHRQLSRRTLLGSGLAVTALVGVTACSTGSRDGGGSEAAPGASASSTPTDTFPVTVKHALGSTSGRRPPSAWCAWVRATPRTSWPHSAWFPWA